MSTQEGEEANFAPDAERRARVEYHGGIGVLTVETHGTTLCSPAAGSDRRRRAR